MNEIHALVLTGLGINCEEEMAAAYRLAGATAHIAHINDIFTGRCSLSEFHVLNFPGGFSFGDDLGAGRALANRLKFRRLSSSRLFVDELEQFLADGKFIFGVCNGFQVLVQLGLVPNIGGTMEQEVTLTHNDSGRFEDRWCPCIVPPDSFSPFLSDIEQIDLPVRHGEGKLVVEDDTIRSAIHEKSLACLLYVDPEGRPTTDYPWNPNGSELNCAGLSDTTGQILGMMPHPEAFLSIHNHPNWGRMVSNTPNGGRGQGLRIFENIVNHLLQIREERKTP